jgi:hypothetical protein
MVFFCSRFSLLFFSSFTGVFFLLLFIFIIPYPCEIAYRRICLVVIPDTRSGSCHWLVIKYQLSYIHLALSYKPSSLNGYLC